jgi:myo-inositol-1(or 4)-monophosphatase
LNRSISHENLLCMGGSLLGAVSLFQGGDISITYKAENDAVSDFDIFLQKKVFIELSELDPDVPVLSEEKIFQYDSQCAWIIDPLDGTSNYIQGLPPSAIVAAKVNGTEVLASLIVDISSGDIYTAIKGNGSRFNGKQLMYKPAIIKLMGASTGYLKRGGQIPEAWNARILGSQALHLCMVARGVFSACVNYEAKAWDDVAGSLIVSESGGSYSNQYPGETWVKLAIDGLSLASFSAHQSEDFKRVSTLVGDINYG